MNTYILIHTNFDVIKTKIYFKCLKQYLRYSFNTYFIYNYFQFSYYLQCINRLKNNNIRYQYILNYDDLKAKCKELDLIVYDEESFQMLYPAVISDEIVCAVKIVCLF